MSLMRTVSRKSGFYVTKVLVPLYLLVLLSFTCFVFSTDDQVPTGTTGTVAGFSGSKLPFTAPSGSYGGLTPTSSADVKTLGTFADGTPAVTQTAVEKGQIVKFGWLPGVSYWFSHPKGTVGNRPRNESIRKIVAGIATDVVGIVPPVVVSTTRVEMHSAKL